MMKNQFQVRSVLHQFIGLTFLLTAFSCKQSHTLEGDIIGLESDIIFAEYLLLSEPGELFQDTLFVQDGRFQYDLPYDEPILIFLFPRQGEFTRMDGGPYRAPQKGITLLLKPEDEINIQGELKEYYLDYKMTGSEFNERLSEIRQGYIEQTSEAVLLELKLDTLMFNSGDQELIEELFGKRNELNRIGSAQRLAYIKDHWDRDLSAYYLAIQPPDTMGKYYSNLAPEVREGLFENMLEQRYLAFQRHAMTRESGDQVAEGSAAPDFSLENIDGTEFTLGSLKDRGQYVVIYFWGSWCPPCIREFPQMKEYYEKYKDDVEFVGISSRDSDEDWRAAVEKYDLNWIQVINNPDIDYNAAVMYGVQAYPTKFILDKDFNILGKYIGSSDDFYKKLDDLMAANEN